MLFKGLLESIVLTPYNMLLQIVAAIKRILYATDEDDGAEALSPIEEKTILETQNRKKHLEHRCRCCWKYNLLKNNLLRQRLSDASDVHCSGSPLLSYRSEQQLSISPLMICLTLQFCQVPLPYQYL
ncbi:hypothetical protein PVK06_043227 [Gossypium arboreum]|uniref:Uncharacterized protein n=1 Tax=Gossypium arboreum TaxID=29729 RepID=A0ABR0MNA5_GOSAR|nr:hypothetical protein PVK06_043227 [Gossypium arboreum]